MNGPSDGSIPWRTSRPHPFPFPAARISCDAVANLSAGGNRFGPTEAEPGRCFRVMRVDEMGEAVPGLVLAGPQHSRGMPCGCAVRVLGNPALRLKGKVEAKKSQAAEDRLPGVRKRLPGPARSRDASGRILSECANWRHTARISDH